MRTQIATRPAPLPDNPYLPHQARITSIRRMTPQAVRGRRITAGTRLMPRPQRPRLAKL